MQRTNHLLAELIVYFHLCRVVWCLCFIMSVQKVYFTTLGQGVRHAGATPEEEGKEVSPIPRTASGALDKSTIHQRRNAYNRDSGEACLEFPSERVPHGTEPGE